MTKEQELIIKLLAQNITGEKAEFCGEIDWMTLIKESIAQTVSLVAFDSAATFQDKIPKDIYTSWFNHTYGSMAINSLVEKSQNELVGLLEKNNYGYVILKGLSSAAYYNKPELRTLGDVDFLIEADKKSEIKGLLTENGYAASHEDHVCHMVFTKPKAHLEMHFEISGVPNGENGDIIRDYMKNAVKEGVLSKDGFYMPSPHHHAVILLLHTQHHLLGEGIGLRHLMDWACFVHKTATELFWIEKVIPLLNRVGLFEFANALTALCIKYFGIASPEWASKADETLLSELMEDIFAGGNFGKKDKKRAKSGTMISNRGKDGTKKGKLYYLYKTLVSSTYEVYPITKKYKILRPFVDFYRVLRYGVLRIFGKKTSLLSTIPLAEKRKNIYKKLHIFEVKEYE